MEVEALIEAVRKIWLIDWLIEDILQAQSTMSGDLRA